MNKSNPENTKAALHLEMMHAIKEGDEAALRGALERGANPSVNNSEALGIAAKLGFSEGLKLLIPLCDEVANNSQALYLAITCSHPQCVEILLPVSRQDKNMWDAAWEAVLRQDEDCLDIFKQVIHSPLFKHAEALEALGHCISGDRFEFFETLLGRVSDADLKWDSGDSVTGMGLLIKTLRAYRYDPVDEESHADSRYLEALFDRMKGCVSVKSVESLLNHLNRSKEVLERQGIKADLVDLLRVKWEQWQLEGSTPMISGGLSGDQDRREVSCGASIGNGRNGGNSSGGRDSNGDAEHGHRTPSNPSNPSNPSTSKSLESSWASNENLSSPSSRRRLSI